MSSDTIAQIKVEKGVAVEPDLKASPLRSPVPDHFPSAVYKHLVPLVMRLVFVPSFTSFKSSDYLPDDFKKPPS